MATRLCNTSLHYSLDKRPKKKKKHEFSTVPKGHFNLKKTSKTLAVSPNQPLGQKKKEKHGLTFFLLGVFPWVFKQNKNLLCDLLPSKAPHTKPSTSSVSPSSLVEAIEDGPDPLQEKGSKTKINSWERRSGGSIVGFVGLFLYLTIFNCCFFSRKPFVEEQHRFHLLYVP